MGRRSQKECERKRAASTCQSIETFLPPKRKATTTSDSESGHSTVSVDPNQSVGTSTADNQTDLVQLLEPSCSADAIGGEYRVTATTFQEAECSCHSVDSGSEPVSGAAAIHDIGDIFVQAKSPSDFCRELQSLLPSQKYQFLKNPQVPHKDHVFPTQYLGGCNRSFRQVWLSDHPWMVYSERVDGVLCTACAFFCAGPSKGVFVSKPFRVWNKKSEKAKEHESCQYHQRAMEQADQ